MDYKTMNFDYIVNYCKEHDEVAWLKQAFYSIRPSLDKYGNQKYAGDVPLNHETTFIELKLDFCRKFMPEILPKPKEKKPTMLDIIDAL